LPAEPTRQLYLADAALFADHLDPLANGNHFISLLAK
jgi:hypothetical protein